MEIFLFWVGLAIAVGIFASNRGRSGFGWFLISLVISPLLGLIFVAVMKNLAEGKTGAPVAPGPDTHVKCPACAEWVRPEATICKHCRSPLTPSTTAQAMRQAEDDKRLEDSANLGKGFLAVVVVIAIAALVSALS